MVGGDERGCLPSSDQAPGISLSALPNCTDDGYGRKEQTQKGHGTISGQLWSQDLHSGSPLPYRCITVHEDHSIWSLLEAAITAAAAACLKLSTAQRIPFLCFSPTCFFFFFSSPKRNYGHFS